MHVPLDGFDDIVRFVREPEDTGGVIGEKWHMDLAWMERPPGMTMLYGEVIPPVGGDTCFASLEHALKALSPGCGTSSPGSPASIAEKASSPPTPPTSIWACRNESRAVEDVETEHPVICAHPATGTPYLFVSSVLRRFKGLTEAESQPIIDHLLGVATRPEFTCRMRWEPRTLGMWANPFVLHTAINDYPGQRRVMLRTTVEGALPRAAAAAPAHGTAAAA